MAHNEYFVTTQQRSYLF